MPITDLLDRIPFSPSREAGATDAPPAPQRSFTVEALDGDGAAHGVPLPPVDPPAADPSPAPPPPAAPLPSWGVAVIGGLTLLCATLAVILAAVLLSDGPPVAEAAPPAGPAPASAGPSEAPAPDPTATPASFTSEPASIPVDLLTRLEAASDEPLDVELSRLLDAVQHGFGRRSAILSPTLRSYVYRMSARFEWNPDSFRVAVTAPDAALAAARGDLLEHLFEDAVAAGRLTVGTGVGPHALTLVAEPTATD